MLALVTALPTAEPAMLAAAFHTRWVVVVQVATTVAALAWAAVAGSTAAAVVVGSTAAAVVVDTGKL
jgi:hypothetical protein